MTTKEEVINILKFYGAKITPGKGGLFVKDGDKRVEVTDQLIKSMFSDVNSVV